MMIDEQARQLDSLTSEVTAQGRLIDMRLRYIDRLEKQVGYSLVLLFLLLLQQQSLVIVNKSLAYTLLNE